MSISHTVNTAERKLRLVLSFVNSVPVSLSCLTLCNPTDCSPPVSLLCVHGIFQARILEWVAIFSSRGSSRPRDQTQVSSTANRGPWTGLKYLLPIHHETKRFCQHINNLYQKQPVASSRIFFFFPAVKCSCWSTQYSNSYCDTNFLSSLKNHSENMAMLL